MRGIIRAGPASRRRIVGDSRRADTMQRGAPTGFTDWLQDLFADFGPVSLRPMFGGHGLYRDGVIFGIAIDEGLYLKVDALTQARFEAAGARRTSTRGSARRSP
jgi:hypothetical protein